MDRLVVFLLLVGALLSHGEVEAALVPSTPSNVATQSVVPAIERLAVGESCASSDPDFLCLGVKYVVYSDRSAKPVISPETVTKNFAGVNSIWKQCRIGFQVDEFAVVAPDTVGVPVDTAEFSDLDKIRKAFERDSSLLIVTTYKWNRQGNLGRTPANAWTKMPGSGLYGVVLEQKVGSFPNIIAHELGHYLNLYHVKEKSEVMNDIIYGESSKITPEQCATARTAIQQWWPAMVRRLPAQATQPQLAKENVTLPKKS